MTLEEAPLPRRLAAILHADVVGYAGLMELDEAGTLARLKAHRKEFIDPTIKAYHGRIVKLMGDGALVEFPSVVEAVACAVVIQEEMTKRNQGEPDDRRIEFRMGVNLGDVIVEGDDIYGEGVNVAARLEGLAEPGGVCISGAVHDALGQKLPLQREFVGEQTVKNIAEPVRVYHVRPAPGQTLPRPSADVRTSMRFRRLAAVGGLFVITAVGIVAWLQPFKPDEEAGSVKPTVPLSAKPSIAVLPFANMSGDATVGYFSDGVTEDIITELSRYPQLLVIARQSSYAYRDKPVTVQQIAEELNVRYVLEGSVRKGANTVRVTAQLIDARTGHHVWAERYDEEDRDVFALQDQFTQKIVRELAGEGGRIRRAGYRHAWGKDAASLEEYDYFLRVHSLIYRFNRTDMYQAHEVALEGLGKFPESSLLRIKLGWTHFHFARFGWSENTEGDLQRAFDLANHGLADEKIPPIGELHGRWLLATLYIWYKRDFKRAYAERNAILTLFPNDPDALVFLSRVPLFAGNPDEALESLNKAIARQPHIPFYYHRFLGWAYYLKGNYREAVAELEKTSKPDIQRIRLLAASYAQLDLMGKAQAAVREMLAINPTLSLSSLRQTLPYEKNEDLDRELADLRKAGLPE